MASRNRASVSKKLNSKNQSSSTNQGKTRKIEPVGTNAFFEPEANTTKKIETEDVVSEVANSDVEEETAATETVKAPVESISTTQEETTAGKPQTETKKSTTSTKSAKSKPASEPEAIEKGELVKTTVYIEEDNFLALEEIQLKLKRKEKRRVTKNELFNTAIDLLIKHYSD